jgi:formate C-acetyltransferase
VDDLELLTGRLAPEDAPEAELEKARKYLAKHTFPKGQSGHCELDLSGIYSRGIDGVRDDLAALRSRSRGRRASVYQSMLYALEGLSALAENAASAAEAAMGTASPGRRDELRLMAETCRRVAHKPPATFRDAVQLLWLADLGTMHGEEVRLIVPGRIDRSLWPFYEADHAAGRLSREEALVLIESLYLLINEYTPIALAVSVMVGGRDGRGRDTTNELSYLCMEAIRRTALSYPTVGVCWHDGTPQALTDLTIELIAKGYTTPAFFGDATIQAGLRRLGAPKAEACHYINSTCVEITPIGSSNVWVASPYFNLCQTLLEEIAAQAARTKRARPAATFERFLAAYEARLARAVAAGVRHQNRLRHQRQEFGARPLQSVFTRDCIARGRDIEDGGATYNWLETSTVGLANAADSLQVVEDEVYREKRMTLAEMKAALDADFAGNEGLRLRFLKSHPKYGNTCAEVDARVKRLVKVVTAECAKHRIYPGQSKVIPGSFCWIVHELYGRDTAATPDGRRARFPFADGAGPAQGREGRGPTAAILSMTSWDHSPMLGGIACNMKFSRSLFRTPEGRRKLRDLVLTYLRRGGFEIQINVVDQQTLLRARKNPEQYRDLVVRVAGYTDYFTRLSPEMQEEILLRTQFGEL